MIPKAKRYLIGTNEDIQYLLRAAVYRCLVLAIKIPGEEWRRLQPPMTGGNPDRDYEETIEITPEEASTLCFSLSPM